MASRDTYTHSFPLRYGQGGAVNEMRHGYELHHVVGDADTRHVGYDRHIGYERHIGAEKEAHFHQKRFYNHLRMHPSYYLAAQSVAKRLAAKDPQATADMKKILEQANAGSFSAINTAKAVGVVLKFEHMIPGGGTGPYGLSISGLLPAAGSAAGKFVRLVLSPAAWALGAVGQLSHWTGNQFGKLSHAL